MLKSLEISGFKSFAKKTELQFKSKVTAIVGPNGSGKSNVAEAFRFVLGEQSIKSMRGKRGEDLIWNGSTEISRANRASVKLNFDNPRSNESESKNIFGLDFDEIIIERVVNRDGGNEYYLNGSLVRLKDIIELLSRAHIGASGHHIISQGEADRILSASDKERREMIEDALGLKIYQYKREESERKLLKTEENIKQVESLRREIAPHIKFLKKQVEKVEKAEELRLKLVDFYKGYLKRKLLYIEERKHQLENARKPLQEKLQLLADEMERAKQILNDSSNKDGKSQELLDIEDRIKKERENKDRLYREIGKIEGEIAVNQRNIEQLEAEQRSEENKTIPLREVEALEKELSSFSEIGRIIERIREFIRNHRNIVDNKHLNVLVDTNKSLAEKKTSLDEKIGEAEASLFELSAQYQKIKESIEREKDSSREAEKAIFKIASEESESRNKLELLEMEEKSLRTIEEDWKMEVQEGGVLLGTAILGFENKEIDPESHLAKIPREECRKELERMKIRLEELGGAGGAEVIKEYKETTERDEFLAKELDDLHRSAESLQMMIKDLIEKLDIEFNQGIEKINKSFNEYFSLMFDGGTAELKIEKIKLKTREDKTENGLPTEEIGEEKQEKGIEIAVSLPRKRIRGLEMLSGGERALTSIALLFAISQVNPPPFIILDETDAALDEANSKKYGDMIENLSKVSQLILITHNRETMSRAGVIYGVTMGRDGVSRLLSIQFDEAVAVAK
jgi:chromosome segregation protein